MRIGVDLVDVGRLERILASRPKFRTRVFSDRELSVGSESPGDATAEFLAGRFAVKEAVLKALGRGLTDGIDFTHVETLRAPSGAPELHLSGSALSVAEEMSLSVFNVSISHDGGFAIAFVLLGP